MSYGNIVLANTKKGLTPKLIRFFTKSFYSHSLITIPDILGIPMCMEAADSGCSHLRFDKGYIQNPDQDYIIYEVNINQSIKDLALIDCFNRLQEGYGFLELPWFMWRALNKFFGRDIKNQNNWSSKGVICSELCVYYLEQCNLKYLFDEYGDGSISAEDLKQIMDKNPSLFTRVI